MVSLRSLQQSRHKHDFLNLNSIFSPMGYGGRLRLTIGLQFPIGQSASRGVAVVPL
jgi:hypothetical protein